MTASRWPLRLIQYKETEDSLRAGDCFYYNPPDDYDFEIDTLGWYWPRHFARPEALSQMYFQRNANRKPLLVYLPGRTLFCVDGACWKTDPTTNKMVYYGGWNVTGDHTNLTLTPSINIVGSYHGFIQNGFITEDCEGRKFQDDGTPIR